MVTAAHLAESPDTVDVEHGEPMLYLGQVNMILGKVQEYLDKAAYKPQGVLIDIVVDHGYSPDNVAAELLHGVQCFDSELFNTLVSIKGVEL